MGVDFWLAGWLGWLGLAGWLAGWPSWGLAFGYGYRFLLLSVVPSTLKSNQYFQNPWLGLAWLGLAGWLARLGFSFLHGFRFLVLNGTPMHWKHNQISNATGSIMIHHDPLTQVCLTWVRG